MYKIKFCKMDEFKEIEEYIKDYLDSHENMDDLKMIKKMSTLIINSEQKKCSYEFTKKYSIKTIDKYVSEFLDLLNPKYKEYYDLRKKDGTFVFDENEIDCSLRAFSSYSIVTKKRIIYIPLKGTIEDGFSIVHELMHDYNLNENEVVYTRKMYTEAISILIEILFEEFLIDKKIEDSYININNLIYGIKHEAIGFEFNMKLLTSYIKKGYFEEKMILDIINNSNEKYRDDIMFAFNEMILSGTLTIDKQKPYILGAFIAYYMYDKIKENRNNIKQFFVLNQRLNDYKFDEVLSYIDLDFHDNDLTFESYKKLNSSYKKILK